MIQTYFSSAAVTFEQSSRRQADGRLSEIEKNTEILQLRFTRSGSKSSEISMIDHLNSFS